MDYDDMLDRGMEETPESDAESERFAVSDADVRQEGNATVFENFRSITDELGRAGNHLLKFIQDEFGTNAGIDESGRARLTGEFDADRIDDAVASYTDRYVRCPECGLPDTVLEREQGVVLLECEACGARSPTTD